MADDSSPLNVSWCNDIGTRDGSLAADAKMVNCFVDKTPYGNALVKRPGTVYANVRTNVPGAAQGQLTYNGAAYYITGDTLHAYDTLYSTPIPSPNPNSQPYATFDSPIAGKLALLQSVSTGLWTFDGSVVTKVTDINYNSYNVQQGIAFLDGVYYAMTLDGRVIGSAINDPTTWPALDFVGADYQLGAGVTVGRHLNYIVAYYSNGIQVYYDANSAPNGQGTALGQVSSATFRTGMFGGSTLVEISDTSIFLAQDVKYGRTVQALSGLTLSPVSTPFVEKILNNPAIFPASASSYNFLWAFGAKVCGHSFYVLVLQQINTTLVYDLTMGLWYVWTSRVGNIDQYFIGRWSLTKSTAQSPGFSESGVYVQDLTTGLPMEITPTAYTDATGIIHVVAVTPNYDWGTMNWKRFAYGNQFADTLNTIIGITYSDDDYQTWSDGRQINLNSVRKQMRNAGSSRRRAFKMEHTDPLTPLRLFDFQWTSSTVPR